MSAAPSDALVFFGATGDLAYKQIFPALQGLVRDEGINVPIVGVAKSGLGNSTSSARAPRTASTITAASTRPASPGCSGCLNYVDGDYNDPQHVRARQAGARSARSGRCTIWRFRPRCSAWSSSALAKAGLSHNARLVVEKPFGRDRRRRRRSTGPCTSIFPRKRSSASTITSARSRSRTSSTHASPTDVRADLESPIRAQHPDHHGGIVRRGGPRRFYDSTGALRDVVQNHMLQVLANLMMDPPTGEDHEASRDQKAALLKAIRPARRGQHRARPVSRLPGRARRQDPIRPSRPLLRSGSMSTAGAGRACRSISAPASACR